VADLPQPDDLDLVPPPAESGGDEVQYQSLYRRYRPQRFDEVLGQEHVTRALRNAVRDNKVSHAYLFSGPRGTGKTSTARILAMALNCEHPVDGEPDGTCPSCVEIRRGASLDVHELDAASNRKLDEMRDLLSRVALGTRGRWKVYIVDEVHQLTSDAASALLKTLEEPPSHVVFVLATTDPQKVLPTIRSRTQHFEFRLLGADVLGHLLADVNAKAGLGLPPDTLDVVIRRGNGSARDALSALDQVAAAGDVSDDHGTVGDIVEAVVDQDPGRVLTAVAKTASAGRDPRRLVVDLLEYLRNGFLATQARDLVLLPDDAVAEIEAQAKRLGLARLVRTLDVLGAASVDMREAVDPRVTLEAALVRLAAPATDTSTGALLERLERLEQAVAALSEGRAVAVPPTGTSDGRAVSPAAAPAPAPSMTAPPVVPPPATSVSAPPAPVTPVPASPASNDSAPNDSAPNQPRPVPTAGPPPRRTPAPPAGPRQMTAPPPMPGRRPPSAAAPAAAATPPGAPPAGPRPALGAHRRAGQGAAPGPTADGPTPQPERPAPPDAPPSGPAADGPPSRDELTKAWGDSVLPKLRPAVKAYVAAGRFLPEAGGKAVYALPDAGLLGRAKPLQPEMEQALAAHFGRPVPLTLVVDGDTAPVGVDAPPPPPEDDDSVWDVSDLQDAGPGVISPEQRLLEAFPGAEEVTP
jgi:DNA polymerase III subunit gamma/tau